MPSDFVWRDAGRTVLMREDGLARAREVLAEQGVEGFELLTTERILRWWGPLTRCAQCREAPPPRSPPGSSTGSATGRWARSVEAA